MGVGRKKSTKKNHKLEHGGREEEKITGKQDDKYNCNYTATHRNEICVIDEEANYKSETLGEETMLNFPVMYNESRDKECVVRVEVYKEPTEEIEKHDCLDEPEKIKSGKADDHLDHEAEIKDKTSVSVQTDLDMFGIELIESKVKELSRNITKEQQKLSFEWKKGIRRTRDDIQDDKVIASIEFSEIENIKYKIEELEIKLNVFFDKNFDKTVTLLEKVTKLYSQISKHKNWEKYLMDELNNKKLEIREAKIELKEQREEIKETKLELKEKREEIKETKLELKEEKDNHKNLKKEMIVMRDDFSKTRHKLSAIEEKYRTQEISTSKQAEALNAVIAEVEILKCQQAARVRQEADLPTVTGDHGGHVQPDCVQQSQKDKFGCDGEAIINEMMTEEFDIGAQEREFEDLIQFPVQESQDNEETDLKKYVMDDVNFSGRYEFYLRQFEVLGLFSDED